jgi:hypothetical protein
LSKRWRGGGAAKQFLVKREVTEQTEKTEGFHGFRLFRLFRNLP